MKILHIITSLRTGGAERLLVDLLPRLQSKGNHVELIVFNGEKTSFYQELESTGVIIHPLGFGNVYNPMLILKLIPYLKKFDIVHTHNTSPQIFTAIASLFSKVRLVYTVHNTYDRRRSIPALKFFDRWCYGRYAKIICISDKAEENLIHYLGQQFYRSTCTINNGINISRISGAKPINEDVSKKGTHFIITMVAGFREQKDQDTLIRSLAFLPNDCILWLVGDGVRRNELKTLVDNYHFSNRVKFWGIRKDIPEILKASDVIVMSSHWEGFGLAAVEGMAAGKPLIASDVDGLKQVVNGYGLLFPHQDANKLAKEILNLYSDLDYYKLVANKCRARADMYDISKMVSEYCSIYNVLTS